MSFWQEFAFKLIDHLSDYLLGVLIGALLTAYLFSSSQKETVRNETLKEVAEVAHDPVKLEELLKEIKE